MDLPEFIEPAKDLLRKLDRRLLDYKDSHPDACLTFAVYDTDSARKDGDPLYFDADKNASVRELMWGNPFLSCQQCVRRTAAR